MDHWSTVLAESVIQIQIQICKVLRSSQIVPGHLTKCHSYGPVLQIFVVWNLFLCKLDAHSLELLAKTYSYQTDQLGQGVKDLCVVLGHVMGHKFIPSSISATTTLGSCLISHFAVDTTGWPRSHYNQPKKPLRMLKWDILQTGCSSDFQLTVSKPVASLACVIGGDSHGSRAACPGSLSARVESGKKMHRDSLEHATMK